MAAAANGLHPATPVGRGPSDVSPTQPFQAQSNLASPVASADPYGALSQVSALPQGSGAVDELCSGDEVADANMCCDCSDDEIAQGIGQGLSQAQGDGCARQSRAITSFQKVKKRIIEKNPQPTAECVPNAHKGFRAVFFV